MINMVCLSLVAALMILNTAFRASIPNWDKNALDLLLITSLFGLVQFSLTRLKKQAIVTAMHFASVLMLFGVCLQSVEHIQLVLVPMWMDDIVLRAEQVMFGMNTALALQSVVNRYLTEAMMFSYVAYIPLLPLTALLCYRAGGSQASAEYLFALSVTYCACCVGFLLFPIASPLFYAPELYAAQFEGGFFTWCGEWIRANVHSPGGSLPSPHCAATTVMVGILYRHDRNMFYLLLPTMLLIYVATVYGLYHYVWDGIAGIATGLAMLKSAPWMVSRRVKRGVDVQPVTIEYPLMQGDVR
jgi:hypothetical protein